jgi:quercetin dioxygenase-like cupin family protein
MFLGRADVIEIEPIPGWRGRALHGQRMTAVTYEVADGAPDVHEHHHPEEEIWSVIEGELVIWIDGAQRTLQPGDVAVVPPNVPHRVRASMASRALVVDSPVRRPLPGSAHVS